VYEQNEKVAIPKDIQKYETLQDCIKRMGNHISKTLGEIEGSWVNQIQIEG